MGGPQDGRTPEIVNKSQTLCRWGAQDTPSHTRIFMVLEQSTHCHSFRPFLRYPLRLKCPLRPTLFFPGVEFCSFLKAKLCEFLPDLLLLREEDSLPPHQQQEFVPRVKAALHALCHLGRCLPADLVGRPQRQSCPHSLQYPHVSRE